MNANESALDMLRAYWIAHDCRPTISQIAAQTNITPITVRRYMDKTTKYGDPEKVRRIAIALGRQDVADMVKDPLTHDVSEQIMRFMTEKFQIWRESNLEELAQRDETILQLKRDHAEELQRIGAGHQQIVDRLISENERLEKSKASAIEQYVARIAELDQDKANIHAEMKTVRDSKRKHDGYLIFSLAVNIVAFVCILLYLLLIDAPNGSFGLIRYDYPTPTPALVEHIEDTPIDE